MKKLTALLMACATFVCAAVSCGDKEEKKDSSEKKSQTTTVDEEEDTTEEATEDETEEETEDETESENEKETEPAEEASDEAKEQIEKLVNEYADAMLAKDIDGALKCLFPDEIIDVIMAQAEEEGEDPWDMDEEITDVTEIGIDNVMTLNSKALEGATQYYAFMAAIMGSENVAFEIEEGYSFDMTLVCDSNGEEIDMSAPSCAVLIKDYGWKLLPEVDGASLSEDMF